MNPSLEVLLADYDAFEGRICAIELIVGSVGLYLIGHLAGVP